MDLVIALMAAGGVAVAAVPRLRRHFRHVGSEKRRAQTELSFVAHLAEADAVMFGEELARLDARVAGADLDEEARVDYQSAGGVRVRAAHRGPAALRRGGQQGRRRPGCRKVCRCLRAGPRGGHARADVPHPCFFDPRHVPASTEALWNQPGRGSRKVPAGAQDAARRAEGQEPDVTTVRLGGRQVLY